MTATRGLVFALCIAYAALGYALIAWKYQNFGRLGRRGQVAFVALHLWVVVSNVVLFAGWVVHDYRLGSWHPVPLAGVGLFLAGAAVVLWALAQLRAAAFVPSENGLFTGGPYAWVRHPVYAGGMLGAFGLAYAAGSVWVLGYAATLALLLYWVSRSEEEELVRRFGAAYRAYARDRGRFVPLRKPVNARGGSLSQQKGLPR